MSDLRQTTKFDMLVARAEENVLWSNGSDHPWDGAALTDPQFIQALVKLASYAPSEEVRRFCEEWNDG